MLFQNSKIFKNNIGYYKELKIENIFNKINLKLILTTTGKSFSNFRGGKFVYRGKKVGDKNPLSKVVKEQYKKEMDNIIMVLMNSKSKQLPISSFHGTDSDIEIQFQENKKQIIELDSNNISEDFDRNSFINKKCTSQSILFNIKVNASPIILNSKSFELDSTDSTDDEFISSELSDTDHDEDIKNI